MAGAFCGMEVGHVVVRDDGPQCQCGSRGCLEAVTGIPAIRRRVEEMIREGVQTALGSEPFSAELLARCVRENDKAAQALTLEVSEDIAAALASVVTLLNPGTVVLTGALSRIGAPLVENLKKLLQLRCLPRAVADLDMRVSSLAESATAQGAALLARRHFALESAASLGNGPRPRRAL